MSVQDAAQGLRSLLDELEQRLTPVAPTPFPPPEGVDALVHLVLYSLLLWESSPDAARRALTSLYDAIIDPNELRVALPDEILAWIGGRDAAARDRSARMRAVLNDIYRREHIVSLERLASVSKREVREYLDSLEGMPSFVAARVTLFGFGGHAVPTDSRLIERLAAGGALDTAASPQDAERWLERQIRASDAEHTALLLEAWRDAPEQKAPIARAAPKSRGKAAATTAPTKATERRKTKKSTGTAARSKTRKGSRRPKKDS